MSAAVLQIARVRKTYRDVVALDDVTLDVEAGSFTALVGPSGCGKSTLLGVLAGLLDPDSGDVRLDGDSLLPVPAERRPVSLVFQRPLLFPHLTVAQNVEFGLRMHGVGRSARRTRAAAALADVQLGDLAGRRVGELSGGQEQRAALARALVLEPRLLLLDEPFSQLDTALRAEMRALVRRLHERRALTTVFVTHDRAEAVDVADSIVLMLAGRVHGHAPPETFYRRPPSLAAARFFGAGNEITGTVADGVFAAGPLRVPTDAPTGAAVLVVRPESIIWTERPERGGAPDVTGTVSSARFAGTYVDVRLMTSIGELVVHVPVGTPVTVGSAATATFTAGAATIFPAGDS